MKAALYNPKGEVALEVSFPNRNRFGHGNT